MSHKRFFFVRFCLIAYFESIAYLFVVTVFSICFMFCFLFGYALPSLSFVSEMLCNNKINQEGRFGCPRQNRYLLHYEISFCNLWIC